LLFLWQKEMVVSFDFKDKSLGCAETKGNRTDYIDVNNQSEWTMLDVLFRCLDQGEVPVGYVKDTGFFVFAHKVRPGERVTMDPCVLGRGASPCQATRIEWAYRLKHESSGTEVPARSGYADDGDATTYFPRLIVTLSPFVDSEADSHYLKYECERARKIKEPLNDSGPETA
jgi:hypothetical protein